MPRFVILEHDWNGVHWDLMLEDGDILKTWELNETPGAGRSIMARPKADHRLAYLDYEGEVSGGRGSVRRWETGTFDWRTKNTTAKLFGARFNGVLMRKENEWLLTVSAT